MKYVGNEIFFTQFEALHYKTMRAEALIASEIYRVVKVPTNRVVHQAVRGNVKALCWSGVMGVY